MPTDNLYTSESSTLWLDILDARRRIETLHAHAVRCALVNPSSKIHKAKQSAYDHVLSMLSGVISAECGRYDAACKLERERKA